MGVEDSVTEKIRKHIEREMPEFDLEENLVPREKRGRVKILAVGAIRRTEKVFHQKIKIPEVEHEGD